MKILILAVGKCGRSPEADLIERYRTRLPWTLDIREFTEKKTGSADAHKEAEADQILAAIPDGAKVIALDERGKTLASQALAQQVTNWQNQSVSTLVFVIGGADGLSKRVRERADLVISFGAMTWPHMMVRAMLAEQIYRVWSITAGHPYHRD